MRNFSLSAVASTSLALALASVPAAPAAADDSVLFSTGNIAPNVMLLVDNSGSMNEVVWHPAYNPTAPSTCTYFTDTSTYFVLPTDADATQSGAGDSQFRSGTYALAGAVPAGCVNGSREIFDDPAVTAAGIYTRWNGHYLNWYYSTAAAAFEPSVVSTTNGSTSACLGATTFGRYRQSRVSAAKRVLREVICQVNAAGDVRFGIAQFRRVATGAGSDPNGGFVAVPINDYKTSTGAPNSYVLNGLTKTHGEHLDFVINDLTGESWTPLAESLFQIYSYFHGRAAGQQPAPAVSGAFPKYEYTTALSTSAANPGGPFSGLGAPTVPDSPVQWECQKNFVVIITDGESTQDDFQSPAFANNTGGFANFANLIGDYNADGEAETGRPSNGSLWLDDIAKFMHEVDFRPDLANTNGVAQTIDVYTVGFTTNAAANAALAKTAAVGGGQFYTSNDPDQLAADIVSAIGDIVSKAQSFTAATVPASRTLAGEQLYVSMFTPVDTSPYWNGVLRSYRLTAAGEVEASNGLCALNDVTPPCNSGAFLPVAVRPPFWDAALAMPAPFSRNLLVSRLDSGSVDLEAFLHEDDPGGDLDEIDLGVTFPPLEIYNGSIATDEDELTAEIIGNVRGCYMGTGANGVACGTRPSVLSDIFHSNPVVVGQPTGGANSGSYAAFKAANADRTRVIYAGSNGGFIHGFHAGTWQPAATPPSYDAGTGVELFGFMPWPARQNIRHLPADTGGRDYYFVDGSPVAADVWLYTTASQTTKLASGSEWRTVLLGGLRQGGSAYYALNVTNPSAGSCPSGELGSAYPCLMWEFPLESDLATIQSTIGETWGEPVITKIKLSVGGNIVERYVAIVTGGYHATGDPNSHATYLPGATQGRSIWILDVKTGRPIARRQFDTSGDCTILLALQATDEQGMCFAIASSPAVYDSDGDGYADLIVVGDLGGNVWKWVIKDVGWDVANDATKTFADNNAVWPFRKIFRAFGFGAGPFYYKSFFFPPQGFQKNGAAWYALASGERNNLLYMSNALTTADNNRFYVIKDIDLHETLAVPQPVVTELAMLDLTASATCASLGTYSGYYIVGEEGEKWVTNAEMLSDYLFVGSYIPTNTGNPCNLGGSSYLYRFRASCGEPLIDSTPAATVDSRAVDLGAGFPTDPRITVSPSGDADAIVTKQGGELVTTGAGRLIDGGGYWREVQD
jgi:type IV pilus assembly protein PilY1